METAEKNKFISLLNAAVCRLHRHWDKILTVLLCICMAAGLIRYCYRFITPAETSVRQSVLRSAESWLGCKEEDESHSQVIDFYNSFEPSPRGYKVTYTDNWCAAFGSAAALKAGLMDIIPMECSCEQQIELFKTLNRWREDECYLPRTGDYIYYVWDEWRNGDCTAWADHVGIVAETFGPVIKVIEGNKDDAVTYRYIFLNDLCIRGFGLPDYASAIS